MTRDEQEMALWRCVYEHWFPRHGYEPEDCSGIADAAVAEFRKRYPPQVQAPEAVWYDEPPFLKEGATHPCWIEGYALPGAVFWGGEEWQMYVSGDRYADPLAGRRVCPIVKPQEPGQ